MTQQPPRDPTVLDPDGVAYHQVLALSPARPEIVDALERSPLFAVQRREGGSTCEWIQFSAESDPSPLPLGRLRAFRDGVLLEAFSERRLALLRAAAREAGSGEIPADQLRVFGIADALAAPSCLLQPLHDLEGEPLTAREVAADYLRMAWAWMPCEELDSRTPAAVLRTGRGRTRVEAMLDPLARRLRREIPGFPAMGHDELHRILLAEPSPDPRSARRTRSALQPGKD